MFKAITQFFRGEGAPSPEQLREDFQARYHEFRMLLTANTNALETMAEMEEALRGRVPFGFSFIRSRMARVAVQVYAIIRHLDGLAPGRYTKLFDAFQGIRSNMQAALPSVTKHVEGRMAASLAEIDRNDSEECGGKMAHLGELKNNMNLLVPDGFVLTTAACAKFLETDGLREEIGRLIQTAAAESPSELQILSSAIAQLIMETPVPDDVVHALKREYSALTGRLKRRPHLAVRSSALGEDESGASFAGQYTSLLNVHPDNLIDSYKEVIAATYNVQAMGYRRIKGLEDPAMCVGFLEMIECAAGGVVYTRDPLSEHSHAVLINATWGRPKSVVDGAGLVDSFVIGRETMDILSRDIASKETCEMVMPTEGMQTCELPPDRINIPSLTDSQIIELANEAMRTETQFGYPQDIEFAIDMTGRVIFLQARAVMLTPAPLVAQLPDDAEILIKGGIRASGGSGVGAVHMVTRRADAMTFSPGNVLVAPQPTPDLAALLPSASAIVTEQGSAAGHLATVAREFGIPALFGVKDAMQYLMPGHIATVDADGRRVLSGVVEDVLKMECVDENLMEGSPVYESLQAVMKYITPLHLLDPDDIAFRPSNCTSLHDITRFCHEKAVAEMFSFGHSRHFPRYEAKQLHVKKIPKQFWVVDLQDGFKREPDDKWVELGEIGSIPMLALWRGMNAMPWEGPPAMNGRGFLSVMFEASMNPNLNMTAGTNFAFKNYFMISREFCSLQSRFGFHFCSAEALTGEHEVENYIGFRFFGGAAEPERRRMRAKFVGDILEEYGFRTRVWEDSLAARVEGRSQKYMVRRLEVLGHVIMHTRQLDMIMKDRVQVRAHKEKMMEDINSFFRG